jgi:acetyl esterase/lipase
MYISNWEDFQNQDAYAIRREPARVPPALIITAEYDLQRDEAEGYGRRLALWRRCHRAAFPWHIHGFITDPSIDDSEGALMTT